MLLNPTVEGAFGGEDVDLISGDTLYEFKVTKACTVKAEYLDQLLGLYLLARKQRSFPEIKKLATYFARHRHVGEQFTTCWTDRPEFPELERWFFEWAIHPTVTVRLGTGPK
jgi:hypothetical protein